MYKNIFLSCCFLLLIHYTSCSNKNKTDSRPHLYKNGAVLNIVLPMVRDYHDSFGCSLEIPETSFQIDYNYDEPDAMDGFEYLRNYYPFGQSCTIRVHPNYLAELEKEENMNQRFLGMNWKITMHWTEDSLSVAAKKIATKYEFFMHTLQWLKDTSYVVLEVENLRSSGKTNVKYL